MWIQSLGWEDPLEKGKATHSSMLAWEIQLQEETGRLQSMGSQKSWTQLSDQKQLLQTVEGASCIKNLISSLSLRDLGRNR